MFKILLILSLIAYIFYKVGGLFFRAGAASQQRYQQRQEPRQESNRSATPRSKKDFKGGEYVDYEEVK
ncbi:MAG: DUF4834 family protein [Cyclobacteriaceae bacterium]|nr:DUF4834 family protein [Cyclobacteriaceae bacterium]